jgi:hypothetical protein
VKSAGDRDVRWDRPNHELNQLQFVEVCLVNSPARKLLSGMQCTCLSHSADFNPGRSCERSCHAESDKYSLAQQTHRQTHISAAVLFLLRMETPDRYWSGLYWDGLEPEQIGEKRKGQQRCRKEGQKDMIAEVK